MVWFNDSMKRRWDPLGLVPFSGGLEGIFTELFPAPGRSNPPASVFADDDRVLVRAEVPGFGPDDVELTLEGGFLTMRGEVRAADDEEKVLRSFQRRFRLPFRVDPEGVQARIENGLLEVELARAESDRARRIEVLEGPRKS